MRQPRQRQAVWHVRHAGGRHAGGGRAAAVTCLMMSMACGIFAGLLVMNAIVGPVSGRKRAATFSPKWRLDAIGAKCRSNQKPPVNCTSALVIIGAWEQKR